MRFKNSLIPMTIFAISMAITGCTTFKYRDVIVVVRDIETQRPVHGAQVAIVHSRAMFQTSHPRDSVDITNIKGKANLRWAINSIQSHVWVNGEQFGLQYFDEIGIVANRDGSPRPRLVDVQIEFVKE